MKNMIILFLFCVIFETDAFNCTNSTGVYANADNYHSYYVCNNYCPHVVYCQSPNLYFTSNSQACSNEPHTWVPRYYLTGIKVSTDRDSDTVYVRQDGYQLSWTRDGSTLSETFTGKYINETYIRGLYVRRVVTTNCINIFDGQLIASTDRNFCHTYTLHPQSVVCDLQYPYNISGCSILSF